MEILLRLATAQDIAALIELQTRSMSKLLTPYYTAPQITAIVRSQITARSTEEICLIAELTGKIVGFAALLPTQGQISAVFVHPDFARQGVGTKLLVALEKYALSAKCRALSVMSSLTAVAFYQAQGYQILYK